MNKFVLSAAILGAIGVAMPAFADPNPNSETTGQPGNGNQGCTIEHTSPDGTSITYEFKNPGKLLQAIRDAHGWNPKEAVDQSPDVNTVGEGIQMACGAEPS